MSLPWIKFRACDLVIDQRVMHIARSLRKSVYDIAGRLGVFWNWAADQLVDGRLANTLLADINHRVGCKRFAEAMVGEGWLAVDGNDILIPKWRRWFYRHESASEHAEPAVNPSTARSRKHRSRVAESAHATPVQQTRNADATPDPVACNAAATQNATPCNADATAGALHLGGKGGDLDLDREKEKEQSQEENTPPPPSGGAGATADATDANSVDSTAKAKAKSARRKNAKLAGESPEFMQFWAIYPNKASKKHAIRAFAKLSPGPDLLATILAAIEIQSQWDSWQRGFIPHPATWLNGQRWEDQPPPNQAPPPRKKPLTMQEHRAEKQRLAAGGVT